MIDRVEIRTQPYMVSAMAEQAKPIYRRCLSDKGRRWWYAVNRPNAADFVYADGGKGSMGFGGATLRFPLEDGTVDEATGPWHGNADTMFKETGVDIRNRYLGWCIVGEAFEYAPNYGHGRYMGVNAMLNVHHVDPIEGVIHEPYRGDVIAHLLFKKLGKPMCLIEQSSGGGHVTTVNADKASWDVVQHMIDQHPDLDYWLTSPVTA